MELTLVIIALVLIIAYGCGYIFYQSEGHRTEREAWQDERQGLLDRIMAADWQQYKQTTDQEPPPPGGSFLRGYRKELKERFAAREGDR